MAELLVADDSGVSSKPAGNSEIKTLITLFVLTTVCVAIGGFVVSSRKLVNDDTYPEKLAVSATSLLTHCRQFYKGTKSEYVLVCFTDYQCPACRAMDRPTMKFVTDHDTQLDYSVLNFPLSYHPQAKQYAIYATASQEENQFWKTHTALMQGHAQEIVRYWKKKGLDGNRQSLVERSTHYVEDDMKLASTLKVSATPSYFLCSRNGSVYRLKNLDQAQLVMSKGG